MRLDYSVALARALPDAQFAVIPGTGHLAPLQKSDLVNRILLDFLRPERLVALGSLHDSRPETDGGAPGSEAAASG